MTSQGFAFDQGDEFNRIVRMSPDNPLVGQGWHAPGGLLIMIDEASHLAEAGKSQFFKYLKSSASGDRDSILLTLNPTHSTGPAIEALESPDYKDNPIIGWHKIRQSALDSPNVKARREIVPGFCSYQYVEGIRQTEGEDSYEWSVRVLGVPPTEDELTVITPAMVDKAVTAYQATSFDNVSGKVIVGIDTSLTLAGDENTLWCKDDRRVLFACGLRADTSPERYQWAKSHLQEIERTWGKVSSVNIDRMGDAEICGRLVADGYNVNPVGFGDAPHDLGVYRNQRAEMAYNARGWLREKGGMIPPEYGKRLRPECQVQRKPGGDVKQLEDKDAVKKRIQRSCDNFDGFILTFAERPGESAFPTVSNPAYVLKRKPVLVPASIECGAMRGPFRIGFENSLRRGLPGFLCRFWWISQAGESAYVGIHVAGGGVWTCYDAIASAMPLREFVELVKRESLGLPFKYDLLSSDDDPELILRVHDWLREGYKRPVNPKVRPPALSLPDWVAPTKIEGKSGVDALERLLLGTVAWDESAGVWGRDVERAKSYRTGNMLVWYPAVVGTQIDASRIMGPKDEWSASEKFAGGAVVKALRLGTVYVGQ